MRRTVTGLLTAGLLGAGLVVGVPASAQPADPAPVEPTAPYVEGSVLVTYEPGVPAAEQAAVQAEVGAVRTDTLGAGTGAPPVSVLDVPDVPGALAALAAQPGVRTAEPDYVLRKTDVPDDTAFAQLYALRNTGQTVAGAVGTPGADIGATAAWDVTTGSRDVVVGDVDSGIDYTHPDLAANVWTNPGGVGGCAAGTHGVNTLAGTCDPMDDEGHGTHVAGTLGAAGDNGRGVTGVSWRTSIMGLKFLDSRGDGSTSDAIRAISFAVAAKQAGVNLRVLNNSWGGDGYSQALRDAIATAGDNGILFVAAAGNDARDDDRDPTYPAAYDLPNVISVAATTSTDALAQYSNFGARTVDLGAPGDRIYSTLPGGRYGYLSGTSMAAPQVSGAAALLLSVPELAGATPAELKARLLGTAEPVAPLAGRTVTGARLDLCAAVPGCDDSAPPAVVSLSTSGNAGVGVPGVLLTATVAPASATGVVAFRDGAAVLPGCGARPVVGGRAVCLASFAEAGVRTLTATYTGSSPAASGSTTVDVTASPTLLQIITGYLFQLARAFGLLGL